MQGVPNKGALLTQLSAHWFSLINTHFPDLQTHLVSTNLPAIIPAHAQAQLQKRSMLVRRVPVIPLESIVRGYITGSAWSEYKKSGTVHGMQMPPGLQESQKLGQPIWTPSTKAEQGEHDENISPSRAVELVGQDVAKKIEEASLKIYAMVRESLCPTLFPPPRSRTRFLGFFPLQTDYRALLGPRLRRRARNYHCRHEVRIRPRSYDQCNRAHRRGAHA